MTKEEEKYTTLDTEQCKWWVNTLFSMAKEQACNSGNFEDGEEMQVAQDRVIKALEIVEEFEKAQIITGGRLNGRTYAYKCGLEDGKRKALEQPITQEILSHIDTGITATGQSDSYCVGFCNALVWLKSCITNEEPQFFKDTRGSENEVD